MRPEHLEKIKKLVATFKSKSVSDELFQFHTKSVVRIALELCEGADRDVVEAAAWLHDFGRSLEGEHHISGAAFAKKFLEDIRFPQEKIPLVVSAIERHRAREKKPETLEEKILCTADAISHFETVPMLLMRQYEKTGSVVESIDWMEKKLERDWNEKIFLAGAKERVEESYAAAKLLFRKLRENIS